ncbi:KPN_02809 family neutral zinc metallopeptidase [Chryseolinea lacunae]|uniref:Zinc metallopeptidase n=1 Tax=Chryseolinea lacunae TaxID=2801331 RepID=A0ABS1KLG7_9BACT|nr:neutral zinc metallopeptidase [Chryseolinea lacunae]MBL0740083.1 zinc metallopeptidase [Chryseolinea lacunae]
MQWRGRRQSSNVDDQRGSGGGGGMAVKGGLGTIVVVLVISLILGKNPLSLLQEIQTQGGGGYETEQTQASDYQPSAEEQELSEFVKVVLADTEDVWHGIMKDYREPRLVMFSGNVQSACGSASSATGPFYCSEDERVYIDLSFYEELKSRFQAPGDFAQAYVIAHEVGHHVQHLLGITDKVHAMQGKISEEEYNKLSVKLELQADFLAGVWANHAQQTKSILEPGDIDEALNAASAIGDDRLQKQGQGYVVPDSFTHGTSEQRMRWFKKGFETGDIDQGDTFNTNNL